MSASRSPTVQPIIDVWDVRTFDQALLARLEVNADLICSYFERDRQIFLSHDLGCGPERSILRPENEYGDDFLKLLETIRLQIGTQTIRGFHYTRLTDDEVTDLWQNGIHLSTPESLRRRLEAVVAHGVMTRSIADQLYEKSPFHSDQLEARSDKFWMTSHPVAFDDSGVVPLMERWGGEVASMWVHDLALSTPLLKLGRPRIVEVAAPLSATQHSYDAGKATAAAFARSVGAIPSKFDWPAAGLVDRQLS